MRGAFVHLRCVALVIGLTSFAGCGRGFESGPWPGTYNGSVVARVTDYTTGALVDPDTRSDTYVTIVREGERLFAQPVWWPDGIFAGGICRVELEETSPTTARVVPGECNTVALPPGFVDGQLAEADFVSGAATLTDGGLILDLDFDFFMVGASSFQHYDSTFTSR